ncbi:MAG: hypothetical protein ABSG53_34260, partial [Thermoguttaceae bacterium]
EGKRGALFQNAQFLRAVQEGMVAILEESLKKSILQAYASISRANQHILAEVNQDVKMQFQGSATMRAQNAIAETVPLIDAAHKELVRFLMSDGAIAYCQEETGSGVRK